MSYRQKLFSVSDPYQTEPTNDLFLQAVRENAWFHYHHCPDFRRVWEEMAFSPEDLRKYDDLSRMPFLPTVFFKHHTLASLPERRTLIKATSSGTSGQRSRVAFETSGLWCGLKMVLKIAGRRKLFSPCPANYVLMGYQPHRGNDTAVTKTAFGATFFAPALRRTYALRYGKDGYAADLEGVISAVQSYSRSRFPLRFMGFPSYTYFVLRMMEEQGIRLSLKKGSKILLGGGWKEFYTQQVDKEVLYALADKVLGIAQTDIIEFYGAVEHPILYCDCPRHHFHIPAYSRVIIRDVHTLRPVENGRVGLVNLITPMVKATPLVSVMTDDLGILHDGAACGCGIASPYLEIIGRVGLKDIKTCAAGAADLLAGVKL